jgi:hypothetical protein
MILHIAVWSLLVGIFIFQSSPIVGRAVSENKISPIEASHTIDAYLQALTGISDGSQRLSDAVRSLPEGKPLVIFVRDQNAQSEFLGMLVAYLSWPREVRIVKLQSTTAERDVAAINPPSVAGLMFCSVDPPPWLGKGVRLGSSILLVPLQEVKP